MTFGLILVGSELLTGKREDKHLAAVIAMLDKRGLELAWVQIVSDDQALLTRTLQQSLHGDAIVFCCGGIGATPDDRTRQAAAAAAHTTLERHPEGQALLEQLYGERLYPHRIRMIEFPKGASLIPNPINQVPGFSLKQHHFVPGFPSMAWPMLEWVLDTHYAELANADNTHEILLCTKNIAESDLIPQMEQIEREFPSVRISCLPHAENGTIINEYGFRGAQQAAEAAAEQFKQLIQDAGFSIYPIDY